MEKNRNQQEIDRGQHKQEQDMNRNQSGQQQNMRNMDDEHAQDSRQWNNYQGRGMAGGIKDAETSDDSTMGNP